MNSDQLNVKITETLEQNKNSIELAFINFLNYIFKISDNINEKVRMEIGSKILKEFSFSDYFQIGLILDKIDIYNFNNYENEIKEIVKIVEKYKGKISNVIDNLLLKNEFKIFKDYLNRIRSNINKINESSKKYEKSELEISKIYKPKIDTSKIGIQGAFKKDTKTARLRKDPYDRKFTKYKKGYLEESIKFKEEDLLISKKEKISDEKKQELMKNLEFLKINFDDFSDEFLKKIKPIIKNIFLKIKQRKGLKNNIILKDENT